MENNSTIKIKYLANLAERFSVISGGIKQNQDKWQSFNITAEVIQAHIENILDTGKEIEDLKKLLSEKLSEARKLKEEKKLILMQLEKRAVGIHADDETKLNEYGL